jgi:hypothetical protein
MVSERKRQRQLEATKARLKKVYSLSFGLLRSDAVYEKFREEWSVVQSSGQTLEQIKVSVIPAVELVQNNAFTRSSALLALHLSALYAVVEKWQKWKFVDSEAGSLLQSPFLKILKKYRHTVFHVDRYDANGTLDMLHQPEILSWTRELSEAIRRALRDKMPKSV